MKFGKQVTFEVATLRGRVRFRSYAKALECWEGINGPVWLEEWHGNKLVRTVRRG